MNRLARRFLILGVALVATLVTGTVGFTVIDHYPVFDAFYMTLITMTTVGYAEVHPLSHAGRVFNAFLIFFGVTFIFIAIGAMTQTIIELEFGDVIGKRRNKRMIDKLKDHYIICGFGRVGRGAASELQRAGVPFVVVDIDPDRVERAMTAGMLGVAADSTRDDTLREVGIERARGLVAALATDAGHRLAQSLLRPHVVQFLDFTTKDVGEDIAIEQVRVAESSEMVSRTIREM